MKLKLVEVDDIKHVHCNLNYEIYEALLYYKMITKYLTGVERGVFQGRKGFLFLSQNQDTFFQFSKKGRGNLSPSPPL